MTGRCDLVRRLVLGQKTLTLEVAASIGRGGDGQVAPRLSQRLRMDPPGIVGVKDVGIATHNSVQTQCQRGREEFRHGRVRILT
jgi:hypothetical protein